MTTLPQTTSIQLPRPTGPGAIIHGGPGSALAIAPAGQMTSGDIWRIIRTNIWFISGSLIVSIILGFTLNWYLNKYYARYTATGLVQIQAGRKNPLLSRQSDANQYTEPETLIVEQRTQTQFLTTENLLTTVLKDKQSIRQTSWFRQFVQPDGTFSYPDAIEDLSKHFTAYPIPDSKLIAVSMTWKDAADCKNIVTDIVDQHIDDQRKVSIDTFYEQLNALSTTITRYESLYKNLKNETSTLAVQLNLEGQRPGGMGPKEQELQLRIVEKLKAEGELADAQAALDAAKSAIESGNTPGYVDMMVEQNMMVQQLAFQLTQLDIQIRAMQNVGPESTEMKRMIAQREATQDSLDQLRASQRAINSTAYVDNLTGRVAGAQSGLKQINQQIDSIKSNIADMATKMADYLTKRDEMASYEELLRQLNDQKDAVSTAQSQLNMNAVAWGMRPVTPLTPSFPKLPVTLAVCIMLGLGLSLGISFLREIMDTSVRSPRDIARVGHMTLLGMIPDENDDPQAAGIPLSTVIYAAPNSMLAEQFRQVRTRLQHAASLDTTRSIMVTSPSPGDGKSTVACNLAAGLALNGRRILLVDANFRRPELQKIFGVGNEVGFGSVLSSIENFESAIRQTKVPNLDLITSGPKPANATELLESQLLVDFIERALEEYDHVIFDTGPMLVVSETVALAPRVDGVVTVVRARANSRGLLTRMRDQLRQLKAEHLGVVLNGVRATGGGYYGRNIKTYYEYQNGAAA